MNAETQDLLATARSHMDPSGPFLPKEAAARRLLKRGWMLLEDSEGGWSVEDPTAEDGMKISRKLGKRLRAEGPGR